MFNTDIKIVQIKTTLDGLLLGVTFNTESGSVEQLRYNDKIIVQVNNGGYDMGDTILSDDWKESSELAQHVKTFLYGIGFDEIKERVKSGRILIN